MEQIREVFRNVMLRDLRPIEDLDGIRLGEEVRIHKGKKGYVLRFLRGLDERKRVTYRDRLDESGVAYTEGKDYTL